AKASLPAMLDVHFIRENLDAVKANCRNRNVKADPDRVVQLDNERRGYEQQLQELQREANEIAKSIPKEKDSARKQQLIAKGKELRTQVSTLEERLKDIRTALHQQLLTIPNMSHPAAPVGTTAGDNKVLRRWGEP